MSDAAADRTGSGADRAGDDHRREVALRSLGHPNSVVWQFDFANARYEWRRLFAEILDRMA